MLNSWNIYFLLFLLLTLGAALISMLTFKFTCLIFTSNVLDLTFNFEFINLIPFIMVMTISIFVFSWARYYMYQASSSALFFAILFSFVVSMLILICSNSLLTMFLGWEGLGITSFILIVYYQNWSSFSGGLLTLLTNRVGDAILMLSFGYWIIQNSYITFSSEVSTMLTLIFFSLTLTKSAQMPFTSWLPAAMAAPTPVSALVHSSTLVTAGVWLMIKYGNKSLTGSSLWLLFGLGTLSLASMAALMESDAKKVVALSTLSQLGLMFLALFLGGQILCLFHLVMHAFAKANLFLVVGNLIHSRFSLQDARFMNCGTQEWVLTLMFFISILSLSGIFFTSGFYSKDFILMGEFSLLNSMLSSGIFLILISMTLIYCSKFFFIMMKTSSALFIPFSSKSSMISPFSLSILTILTGFIYMKNLSLISASKLSGAYWVFLLFSGLFIGLIYKTSWMSFFISQISLIKLNNNAFMKCSNLISSNLSNSLLEGIYLINSFSLMAKTWTNIRVMILLTVSLIVILTF